MIATNFHRNHPQHVSISEKLTGELKQIGQDMLSQINNLNQKLTDQVLIKVINGVVGGIYGIIPDLQEVVIKSSGENENNADLKDMVQKLSQYCNEMVQGYYSGSSTLKAKFQTFIQNILLDTESLLNIIKKDNLHDFKHELVEYLKDIMYTIQLGQVRMRIESYSQEELKLLAEKERQDYLDNVAVLEKCSLDVLKTMAINVKYNAKHVFKLAYLLNKAASNYDDVDIQRKIIDAANLLNSETAAILHMNEKLTDTKEAVNVLKHWCWQGWHSVKDIYEFNDICFENDKMSENLRDIAKISISYGILITKYLGRGVNYDGLFARQ